MREIRDLCNDIKNELHSAKHYAKMYQTYKNENLSYAKKLYEMSNEELNHAMFLHDITVAKIKEVKSKGVQVPEYMMILWEEEHNYYIDKMAKIKSILAL